MDARSRKDRDATHFGPRRGAMAYYFSLVIFVFLKLTKHYMIKDKKN
jgi:hypothetical protein